MTIFKIIIYLIILKQFMNIENRPEFSLDCTVSDYREKP